MVGAFAEPDADAIVGRVAALPNTDGVFFYPYMRLVLADREHVSSVDIFVPGYTTPEQYQAACREVAARPTWVVYDRQWSDRVFLTKIFPQMICPGPPRPLASSGFCEVPSPRSGAKVALTSCAG